MMVEVGDETTNEVGTRRTTPLGHRRVDDRISDGPPQISLSHTILAVNPAESHPLGIYRAYFDDQGVRSS